jgi:hypothetical protein
VHFSVVFKGFLYAKYARCPIDFGSSRSCHNSEIIFLLREGQLLFLPWINGRMKFTENLLTNIQLSKMLHLEFSAKSSDVTLKIISLSDICSATRLILWVLFSHETLCIFLSCYHQMKIISLLWHDLELLKSIGQLAYFGKHKAFKHDRKMHKVSWENRTQSIKHNSEIIFIWWWILIAWCWSRTCGFKVGTCWQVLLTGKCFVTTFVIFDIIFRCEKVLQFWWSGDLLFETFVDALSVCGSNCRWLW